MARNGSRGSGGEGGNATVVWSKDGCAEEERDFLLGT